MDIPDKAAAIVYTPCLLLRGTKISSKGKRKGSADIPLVHCSDFNPIRSQCGEEIVVGVA